MTTHSRRRLAPAAGHPHRRGAWTIRDDGTHRIISGEEYAASISGSSENPTPSWSRPCSASSRSWSAWAVRLGEVEPSELVDLAWRIDSPELHEIALRIEAGLLEQGRTFADAPAEVLTDLAAHWSIPA